MWERVRFARYALAFERAFEDDNWAPVKAHFHADARYIIEGTQLLDGETRGPDAIAVLFKRMLDELDRKFKRRIPGLRGWPRVDAGELHLPWKVRYVADAGSTVLVGDSYCRWKDGKIIELRDRMNADEVRSWCELIRVTPERVVAALLR